MLRFLCCLNLILAGVGPVMGHPTSKGNEPSTPPRHSTFVRQDRGTGSESYFINGDSPHVQATSSCNYAWPTILAPRAAAQACHDHLAAANESDCSVPPPPQPETPDGPTPPAFGSRVLCYEKDSSDAIVMGATFKPTGTASACGDVAQGVQWILDSCTVDGQVAGSAPAWANGDLLVVVQLGDYLNLTAP
ncbi:hypothetical protein PG994_005252 [Apiospora phragmitis]|uniref:Ecp2 effector protein domain-containing protein n=1 Tax=Apiospora phragmitis TaxID=2905665 RepID=A0ABR1VSW6_9PEZI